MKVIPLFIFSCFCSALSLPSKAGRIIGGKNANPGQYPWSAAIFLDRSNGKYFCGGSLISNQWIVTAGHCVYAVRVFTIYVGSNTIQTPDKNRVILSSSSAITHPYFKFETLENDIGLIKLHMPIQFTDYIRSAILARPGQIQVGTSARALGWGQTSDMDSGLSNNLEWVDLTLISNVECKIYYGDQIRDSMVCAVGNYNEGICIGDTGGPLVYHSTGATVLLGIASFMSTNGCETVEPTGYTRLDLYHDWISNVTNAP